MPESGHFNKDLSSNISKKIVEKANSGESSYNKLYDEEAIDLADKHGEKFLGQGNECVVVTDTRENNKVAVAFSYDDVSPQEAITTFYLQRFFSTLFPNNFPHFYLSKSAQKGAVVSVREYIQKSPIPDDAEIFERFKRVEEVCESLGIKVFIDGMGMNWTYTESGDIYYVDSLKSANFSEWDENRIIEYMRNDGYSDKDINVAKTCIKRLKLLPDTYIKLDEDVKKRGFMLF